MKHEQTWDILRDALKAIEYNRDKPPSGRFSLRRNDEDNYALLTIYTYNPNTYKTDEMRHTRHEFVVPVATYNFQAWVRWIFDKIVSIEVHETCEWFFVRDESKCDEKCKCKECKCFSTLHDGRHSICHGCGMSGGHRFVCEDGHYTRIYAPHHGNGWDPYTFWPGHDITEKTKAPGDA